MSSIFADGALHPGRDAADSWWYPVRDAAAWDGAQLDGAEFDSSRAVVELAPGPLASGESAASIADEAGTEYRSDARIDQVLWRRSCDADWTRVPGTGGTGWATGQFRDPAGLALDDRGWLYVADRGNHRVQVVDPIAGRVVIALGAVDPWGRPAPGTERGQMIEPVAVAVGNSRIFIAQAHGGIHVFDRAFRYDRTFDATRPDASTTAVIVGLGIARDDALVVADAGWSRLLRFSCSGELLGELASADAPDELNWIAERARFAATGTVVIGPVDGGVDRTPWHEIAVDALLPAGTSVEVQTFAADPVPSPPPGPPPSAPPLPVAVPWAPELPVAMPVPNLELSDGELARPVLSDTSVWNRWQSAPYLRGRAVHQFIGDGPNAAATMTVPAAAAAVLRADDDLELRSAAGTEAATVLSIAGRVATVEIAGPGFVDYAMGTTLTLIERDGRAVGHDVSTLAAGEVVPLSAFTADGEVGDVVLPHAVVALFAPGDLVELAAFAPSTDRARLRFDAIDSAPVVVGLVAPVVGDHRDAELRMVAPAGRLVVDDATDWGRGFAPGEVVDVGWDNAGVVEQVALDVRWSDPTTATVWTTAPAPATWLSLRPGAEPTATDRGRYLWVKLRLLGARHRSTDLLATATPTVRGLRLVAPRPSYLGMLPAVFSRRDDEDPTGALFLERFLALFENRLTGLEDRYEAVARLLNPFAADDEWLSFVASWFDLSLDPSWPRERRSRLVAEIFSLYRIRGTVEGIRRAVELYTGRRPELIEGFQTRPRGGMALGYHAVLGCSMLEGRPGGDRHAHRFTLVAYTDDTCDLDVADGVIRAIVDAVKPAHTAVDVQVVVPHSRIGVSTTVGLDFLLGDERTRPAPLGTSAPAPPRPAPVLGVDVLLGSASGAPAPLDLPLSPVGDLTLR